MSIDPRTSPQRMSSNESVCALAARCRHVQIELHTPLATTTPTAPRYAARPTPHRAGYGHKSMATPTASDRMSRPYTPQDDVDFGATGAEAAGAFFPLGTSFFPVVAGGGPSSASSDNDANCLSTLASSLSQSRSAISPPSPGSTRSARSSCRDSIAACRVRARSPRHSNRTRAAWRAGTPAPRRA